MSLALGIVGLPNVGKSTLFTALTKKRVAVSNYPFTTIDPNVGVVAVPDERLEKLAAVSRSARIVPATVEFVDIAGLVKGANKGEGLGNQFLAQIREVDAIVEVLRAFEDPGILHVEGVPDPMRDHEIVEAELILKDLETVEKSVEKVQREAQTGAKEAQKRFAALKQIRDALREGKTVRDVLPLSADDSLGIALLEEARTSALLTGKPVLVLLNTAESAKQTAVAEVLTRRGIHVVAADLKAELEAEEMTASERAEVGLPGSSALDRLIREAYETLGLLSFLTTGEKETRTWTIRKGTLLPQAAGVIHSDFEQKFIRADVMHWKDFIEAGGWPGARAKGLIRSEGKEYGVQEGDVLDIKHGA